MKIQHLLLLAVLASTGCGSINKLLDSDSSIDYKSSKAAQKLDVPPDLTQLRTNDRFVAPRASTLSNTPTANNTAVVSNVLPANALVRMERLGSSRFLVVDAPAERVFPVVVAFWKDSGFTLATENPQTGVIETDWAENRNKAPAQGLRRLLGGVLDALTDSGERDQYRTRMERVGNTTEIYLSHRGTQEINAGSPASPNIVNQRRDGSIELESEFLRRLMLRFGSDENTAKSATSASVPLAADRARLIAGKDILEIDDTYDAAWRRVGLALDRSGFTIEDRNFTTGEYFIRYAASTASEAGFFSKLFASDKKSASKKLKLVLQKGAKTNLLVQSESGAAADPELSKPLLAVMRDELK